MGKTSLFIIIVFVFVLTAHMQAAGTTVFINEIHYDNIGTDAGEAIEIAGPAGTDLTGWSIVLYNGSGGTVYNTTSLSGVIPNQQGGYGTVIVSYPVNGIQNGSPDGIALVNASSTVVQFLSYEGTFTAVGGPANGMTSTDIGVSEIGGESVGGSLQLTGIGNTYGDFMWVLTTANTFGSPNTGQTFVVPIHISSDGLCNGNKPCFSSIQDGINSASAPSLIMITQETYNENIVLNVDEVIILGGGWDTSFASSSSYTTIDGSITITNGTMILEYIILSSSIGPPPGSCLDDITGSPRAIVAPTIANLIISEVMIDPAIPLSDATAEWFELYALSDVDLIGLQAKNASVMWTTLSFPFPGRCFRLPAGSFAIIAKIADSGISGIPVSVTGLFDFSLVNPEGSLSIGFGDNTIIDTFTWSTSLAGTSFERCSNGVWVLSNLLPGASTYFTNNFGTPGSPPISCW